MHRARLSAAALIMGACLAIPQSAAAATFNATCGNLQSYLNGTNAVSNGDVVQLTGTCVNQSFTISNTNAFTLQGVGNATDGTPSSGFNGNVNNFQPILSSTLPVKLTIKNLLFTNAGTSAGGSAIRIHSDGEAVTIENDVFKSLSAGVGASGGALDIESSNLGAGVSTPTVIAHNIFNGNHSADGGAIYWENGSPLELTGNLFTANTATDPNAYYPVGGAVDVENYEGPPYLGNPVRISGNTFGGTGAGDGNKASAWGGALYVSVQGGAGASQPAQSVTLDANRFIGNQITGTANQNLLGAGVAFDPQVRQYGFKVVQAHNLFQGNTITGSVSSGYTAGGAGEWGTAVSVSSTGDVFTGNRVSVTGAPTPAPEGGALGMIGIDQRIGMATVTTPLHSSFTGADDVFVGNSITTPDGWGGAIYTGGSVGIHCVSACPPSSLALYDSTLSANSVPSATGEGAAIWGGPADSLKLENSIVHGNTGVPGQPEIFGYPTPTYRYDDLCTTSPGATPAPGAGNLCLDPKLAASGAETAHSPTIDKGSNALLPSGLTTDAAGKPRITIGLAASCPKALVDIGAFESTAVSCKRPVAPSCRITRASGRYTPAHGQGTHKIKPVLPFVALRCSQPGTLRISGVIRETIPGKLQGKGSHRHRGKSHVKLVPLRRATVAYTGHVPVLRIPINLPAAALKALRSGIKEKLALTVSIRNANGSGSTHKSFALTVRR